MDKSFFEGKTIGDIIDEDTKILTKFMEGYDVKTEKIRDISLQQDGPYTVFTDYMSSIIVCFENEKPKALFFVYECMNVKLNSKRGMVSTVGHETHDQYWFDDDEYTSEYTR